MLLPYHLLARARSFWCSGSLSRVGEALARIRAVLEPRAQSHLGEGQRSFIALAWGTGQSQCLLQVKEAARPETQLSVELWLL